MKTLKLTCIALLALVFTQGKAQTATSKAAKDKFVFGVKAGINHSNVYDAQGMGFVANSKTGFAGGIFAALPIGNFLGFQPELLISQKGFKGSGILNNQNYNLTRTTTYMDVPLQLQLKPFRFLTILGGVQYSYLLSQSDNFAFSPSVSVQQDQQFKNDNIRKNIFGAVTGLDINVNHIVVSGRAGWDLTKNNGDGTSYTPRYKNFWLQATVGFRFY